MWSCAPDGRLERNLAALKADPELVDIPVIMLSVADDRNLGFTRGASDYLTKPIDWVRFGSILKKYAGSPAPRRGPAWSRTTPTRATCCGACWRKKAG